MMSPRFSRAALAAAAGMISINLAAQVQTVPGMPPVADPNNLYSEIGVGQARPGGRRPPRAGLRPARAVERRLRDRPEDLHGRRQVQGGPEPAARRALLGPADAVGHQQRRAHQQGHAHADRSEDRQAGQGDRGPRSVQHVLLARRQRTRSWSRRPRSASNFRDPKTMEHQYYIQTPRCAGINHADFSIDGRVRDLHLRVLQGPREDRPGRAQGRSAT